MSVCTLFFSAVDHGHVVIFIWEEEILNKEMVLLNIASPYAVMQFVIYSSIA